MRLAEGARRDGGGDLAQATVEAAVVLPVMIALAIICFNLMRFTAAVARFDRLAPDVVLAHGASPEGDGPSLAETCRVVERELERAMGDGSVEIEVAARREDAGVEGLLSLAGSIDVYSCTMAYRPWPGGFVIAGVDAGAPPRLEHEREVAIDPWRPGVVL